MTTKIITLIVLVCAYSFVYAQKGNVWNLKKCAVVLTYDDALNEDIDNVAPALDSLGLKGTFYLSNYTGTLDTRMDAWKKIGANGHELGNHTYYHPCLGNLPGRGFVTAEKDLSRYAIQRIDEEIHMMNTLLKAFDGKDKRSFAYPCGDVKIGDSAYLDPLRKEFTGARGTQPEMPQIQHVDLYNIGCYGINGQTGAELIALVKKAVDAGSLLVFLFHGVGGGHSLNVSLEAHSQLLHFLKQHEKEIWIAPMTEVASYIRQYQSQTK
ncbi:polysaccharide deacetylase family protein [Danxiaibacter flavus]|uniref:Polysaccharide deacetylase family protein n=1 Tax=Danxiaibacter flavus TaxID=3049108 RepID=A0ABV3ZJG0_9BACT|nr:polysaccharide deacetylase family protein [Chitinophagaceae bacterium DXS]